MKKKMTPTDFLYKLLDIIRYMTASLLTTQLFLIIFKLCGVLLITWELTFLPIWILAGCGALFYLIVVNVINTYW